MALSLENFLKTHDRADLLKKLELAVYLSEQDWRVNQGAKRENVPLHILNGKFGCSLCVQHMGYPHDRFAPLIY